MARSTKKKAQAEEGNEANLAILLTWLLPGAGHLYLGMRRLGEGRPEGRRLIQRGAVAGALVIGVFYLGVRLTGGRAMEFLDPELRGPFAAALTPEVASLGCLLWKLGTYGYGQLGDQVSPFPPAILLGTLLTALSGIANVFLMVQAQLDARVEAGHDTDRLSPAAAVACTWLVPGLGHFLQGRRLRGAVVFSLVIGLFLWGTLLADFSNLSRARHFYYWGGQFLAGGIPILLEIVSGRPPVTGDIRFVDAGLTFSCLAGLLNVIAMLDAYRYSEAGLLGLEEHGGRPKSEAKEAGASAGSP